MMPFKMSSSGISTQQQQPQTPLAADDTISLSSTGLAKADNEMWNLLFRTYAAYQRQHQYDKYVEDAARVVECVGPLDSCHFWLLKLEQANHITTRLEPASVPQIKARLRQVLTTQPGLSLGDYYISPDTIEEISLSTVMASYAALPAAQFSLHSLDKVDPLRASLLATRLCVNRDYYPGKDMHLNPGRVLVQLYPLYSITAVQPMGMGGYASAPPPQVMMAAPPYYASPPPPRAVVQAAYGPRKSTHAPVHRAPSPEGWMSDRSRTDDGGDDEVSDDDSVSGGDDDDEYTLVDGVSKKKHRHVHV